MAKHVWDLDSRGEVEYFEIGDPDGFCGGPHCTVCDEYFCQHESLDWDAECVSAQ